MKWLLPAAVAALALAGPAEAGRFAVGLEAGASPDALAARLADRGSVSRDLLDLGALTLEARSARGVAGLPGVAYVERLDAVRGLAFTPPDPLVARQWYLERTRAFDAWAEPPPLTGPLVALIDSGIDFEHPEFKGRIADGVSFVGGDWRKDEQGHGTFVAGLIAAAHDGKGIAGIAFPSQLLVAKVVRPDRSISLEAEVNAIRWAVDSGARVINLSLGGVRDPRNSKNDTFSALEAAAIEYAYGHGVVLVAAVGNADQAPTRPWPFASYPAALPHVIGVSALARDGSVPLFSDRDRIYNDIAAPGQEILSTFPRALTAARPACANQGYSDCGPDDYRRAEGTSFAAPQVAAAAALLLSVNPGLAPDQVMTLLTRAAVDANASTGCKQCPLQRDQLSGWGRLDIAAAVAQATTGPLPRADRWETNDEAGGRAQPIFGARGNTLRATIDYWDDNVDVYRVLVRGGQRLQATLDGPGGTKAILWRPGTQNVEGLAVRLQQRVLQSVSRQARERFAYRAPRGRGGWYYIQVKIEKPGSGPYTLRFTKR
jgi:hypothetical protein